MQIAVKSENEGAVCRNKVKRRLAKKKKKNKVCQRGGRPVAVRGEVKTGGGEAPLKGRSKMKNPREGS